MDQALAALDELSSRVHDLFSDALKGPGVLSALREFAAAVEWTEPLVLSLLASHAILLTLAVIARKNQPLQLAILALCFALVRGGERLNALAAAKWDEVFPRASSSSPSSPPSSSAPRRRTNYFDDESGVFWSALVSAPLLLVMAVQLILHLRQSWFLMIDLKVAQLRAGARRRREEQRSSGGQGGKAATPRRSERKKKAS